MKRRSYETRDLTLTSEDGSDDIESCGLILNEKTDELTANTVYFM